MSNDDAFSSIQKIDGENTSACKREYSFRIDFNNWLRARLKLIKVHFTGLARPPRLHNVAYCPNGDKNLIMQPK